MTNTSGKLLNSYDSLSAFQAWDKIESAVRRNPLNEAEMNRMVDLLADGPKGIIKSIDARLIFDLGLVEFYESESEVVEASEWASGIFYADNGQIRREVLTAELQDAMGFKPQFRTPHLPGFND